MKETERGRKMVAAEKTETDGDKCPAGEKTPPIQ